MASNGAHLSANATVGAHGAVAVTPNDSTELPVTRALYIGVGGDVTVTMADGQAVLYKNVGTGCFLPIQTYVVWSTGTTATNILALY